jgi:hypothetical protein
MTDVCLPAIPRTGVTAVIGRWMRKWRPRAASGRTIDPGALSDHMQRDLGFRDGRSTPARVDGPAADPMAWR